MKREIRNTIIESVSISDGFVRPMNFPGSDYNPTLDRERLTGQLLRIYTLMRDGKYRTLFEISNRTGDPEASVSAQLRHLRKSSFGGHIVNKQRRDDPSEGLFEYQLIVNQEAVQMELSL